MIRTGMVSVTFRKLSPREIIDLVSTAGLEGIEWGGDIHVPPGDRALAKSVGEMTRDAGLSTPSYGSYFRPAEDDTGQFSEIVETAHALGAKNVRVWAGRQGSAVASAEYRNRVCQDTREIAKLAQEFGMTVSYEYHVNTVADTKETTLSLLRDVDCDNVYTYWQMFPQLSLDENLATLRQLAPHLSNIHVFHWLPKDRRHLSEGHDDWQAYISAMQGTGREHWALLEFVRNDDPQVFMNDAATLNKWIRG